MAVRRERDGEAGPGGGQREDLRAALDLPGDHAPGVARRRQDLPVRRERHRDQGGVVTGSEGVALPGGTSPRIDLPKDRVAGSAGGREGLAVRGERDAVDRVVQLEDLEGL